MTEDYKLAIALVLIGGDRIPAMAHWCAALGRPADRAFPRRLYVVQ
jgi:hypothetical protein